MELNKNTEISQHTYGHLSFNNKGKTIKRKKKKNTLFLKVVKCKKKGKEKRKEKKRKIMYIICKENRDTKEFNFHSKKK